MFQIYVNFVQKLIRIKHYFVKYYYIWETANTRRIPTGLKQEKYNKELNYPTQASPFSQQLLFLSANYYSLPNWAETQLVL